MALQNRGLVKLGAGLAEVQSIPIPKLRDDYILVKTVAVTLNPTDWQGLDDPFKPGATRAVLGCDYSGIVVEVGKAVKKKFKKGDRIAGISHGGNDFEPEDGTFAEYIMVKGDIQFHIPPNISFEEAAALGCGVTTVALGFTKYLELPFMSKLKGLLSDSPTSNQEGSPILIYGGSSATGTIAIQFAKLLGLTVITTSSPRNFELLRSLGADHVLDYHDPNCAQKIRSLTNNSLNQVFDTIATPEAAKICAESLSPNLVNGEGKYVCLLPIELPREDIKSIFFLGYTAMGEAFWFEGETWAVCKEDFELAVEFFGVLEGLLERGLVRSHPVALREGGLEKILEGMGDLKRGVVSGVKLVYLVGEA